MITTNTIQKNKELNNILKIKGFIKYDENKSKLIEEYNNQIEITKYIIKKFGYEDYLLNLKENLTTNKLNISVKDTNEGIKLLKSKNLFKYIGLTATKNDKQELHFPLKFRYHQILSNSEEEAYILDSNQNNNMVIEKSQYDNEVYEVYELIKSTYFIKNDKRSNEYNIYICDSDSTSYCIKYNFIDLYCMLFSLNNKEAIAQLFSILNIKVLSVEHLKNMYLNNIDMLNKNIYKYKSLNKLISKQIPIIIEMMNIALIECYFYKEYKPIGDIYLSQRYLAKRVNKSQGTITPYINGFALLGFYTKREVDYTSTDKIGNQCTIFTINNITEELLQKAEIIAQQLNEHKIRLSKINYNTILNVFGKDIVLNIIRDKNIIGGQYDKICS